MTKTIVICATVAFTVVIAAFVFLSYRHIDTTSLVTFALGLMSGVIPNVASFVKTHNLGKDVNIVKEQTNGPLSKAIEQIDALTDKVQEIQDSQNGEGGK